MALPGVLSSLPDVIASPASQAVGAGGKLALAVATVVPATRLVPVFPATAVGTGATPLSVCWNGTRWQFRGIASVLLLTVAAARSPEGLILLLTVRLAPASTAWMEAATPLLPAIIAGIDVTPGAAAASWLFAGYGLRPETEMPLPARTTGGPERPGQKTEGDQGRDPAGPAADGSRSRGAAPGGV